MFTMYEIKNDINKVDDLGRTLLHKVAMTGNERLMNILMQFNIDLDIQDNDGYTAMHLAVKNGNIRIVYKLIQNGADINIRDKSKWTVLAYACDRCHEGIVKLLLSKGVIIDAISLEIAMASAQTSTEIGGIILDCLKYECNRRIVEAFYSKDLVKLKEIIVLLKPLYRLQYNDILCIGEQEMTTWILEEAHRTNNVGVLKILLENDIELNLRRYNESMLPIVCDYGSLRNVKILLDKGVPIDNLNEKGESCLFIAARNNNSAIMKLLLEHDVQSIINTPNEWGVTPLHVACAYGNYEIENGLIEKGANIYYKINLKVFLDNLVQFMHEYITTGEYNMEEIRNIDCFCLDSMGIACCLGHREIIGTLIYEGYAINRPIYLGNTALHIASMMNNVSLMRYLVSVGSDVNIANEAGNTALHIACFNKKSKSVIELSVMGASALIFNKYLKTPLHIAYEGNNSCIIKFLSNSYNLRYGVTQADINKVTLLHLACKKLDVDRIELLLESGAKASSLDAFGNSPLHYAVKSDIKKDRKVRITRIIRLLKGRGLSINIKNERGYSALDMACIEEKNDDVSALIDSGANLGRRILEAMARENKKVAILQIINNKKKERSVLIEKINIQKDVHGI